MYPSLFNNYGITTNTITKTLPRDVNYQQQHRTNLYLDDSKKRNRAFEFASLHRNANPVIRKNYQNHQSRNSENGNRYVIQDNSAHPYNGDHIYESIDSESVQYGTSQQQQQLHQQRRFMHCYSGSSNNYRSKSTIADDELSSSSIYEDRPLLMSNSSFMVNNIGTGCGNSRRTMMMMPQHYHSNASIYDRKDGCTQSSRLPQHLGQNCQIMGKDVNELPDLLLQKSTQSSNNMIVSLNSGDNRRNIFNKVV